ncbi:MAG: MFS transporter [Nocardioides sp.]|uniref:MFS transporter n=1 Tax=Nocardioides sp. TaxID=35761 RepID=UPI0039E26315
MTVVSGAGEPGKPVLRHRALRWLLAGSTVNVFGGSLTPVAIAFAVLDLGGSATDLGLVEAAYALCQVVTTLAGGVLGDRVSRTLMLEGASAVSAVVVGTLAALVVTGVATIPLIAVLSSLSGVVGALGQPSSRAIVRLVVPEDELARAVAVRAFLQTGAAAVGYATAGILVVVIGSGWAIATDAVTYAVAAVCFTRLDVPHVPAGRQESLLTDFGEGLREVLRHTWLWSQILMAALYHLFYGGAQSVLGPIVVGDGIGRSVWGLALGFLMGGFVLGSVVCLRWRPRHGLFVGVCLLTLTGCFPLAMALTDRVTVLLAGALLHGFGLQIYTVFWETSINLNVPQDRLARVYSIDIAGSFLTRPIGLALTGPVAALVGFHGWLVVVAAVISGAAVLSLISGDVRRLQTTG